MTSVWSVDDFITSSVAALKLRPGLAGIQVTDGWPGEGQENKAIWFDDARTTQVDPRMTGGTATRHVDTYDVTIFIDVHLPGATTAECRTALRPLLEEVLTHFAETKRAPAGSNRASGSRVAGWQYRPYAGKTGRGAAAKVTVRNTARR